MGLPTPEELPHAGGDHDFQSYTPERQTQGSLVSTSLSVFADAIAAAQPRPLGRRLSILNDRESPMARSSHKTDKVANGKVKSTVSHDVMHARMLRYFREAKGGGLTGDEKQSISAAVDTLRRIDLTAKELLNVESREATQAPFKVREVQQIRIGGVNYDVELGRNRKVYIPAAKAEVVGAGAFGQVSRVGKSMRENLDIMAKVAKGGASNRPPDDIVREHRCTNHIHRQAPGKHQTGVQRAPYTLFSNGGQHGYLVPAYLADLDFTKFDASKPEVLDKLGLTTARGLLQGARDILEGLTATHALGIAHRDIKPENMAIQKSGTPGRDSEWCLADFGLADDQGVSGIAGTPEYITVADRHAQDTAANAAGRIELRQAQDMFGLGRSLLEIYDTILSGEPCGYDDGNHWLEKPWMEQLNAFVKGRPVPNDNHDLHELFNTIEDYFGSDITTIIEKMLNRKPDNRPSAEQALAAWDQAVSNLSAEWLNRYLLGATQGNEDSYVESSGSTDSMNNTYDSVVSTLEDEELADYVQTIPAQRFGAEDSLSGVLEQLSGQQYCLYTLDDGGEFHIDTGDGQHFAIKVVLFDGGFAFEVDDGESYLTYQVESFARLLFAIGLHPDNLVYLDD